jgi:hypothetical protein
MSVSWHKVLTPKVVLQIAMAALSIIATTVMPRRERS